MERNNTGCGCDKPKDPHIKYINNNVENHIEIKDIKPNYYSIISVIKDYINGNIVYIDKEGEKYRNDICNNCERLSFIKNCKECGCFVKLKVKYYNSSCPLNKW